MKFESVSSVKPLFQMLVEQTPGVQQAVLHTTNGVAIFAWPTHPIWRASMTAREVYKLTKLDRFDQVITVQGGDCSISQLPRKVLLVMRLNEEICMTLIAKKDCDLRPIIHGLRQLAKKLVRSAGPGTGRRTT